MKKSTRQQPMRKRNKPARFRRSNECVAAVGKCSKDASLREGKRSKEASPGEGKHSKIVANEKPVQLDHVHNAEGMDNIDPTLLFYDEEDYNKLQAMKEVDSELILSRQLKMIRDMNVALKAAEDKEKEQSAEIKEKATATCVNEEEHTVVRVTQIAEIKEKATATCVNEEEHTVVRVTQIEHTSPSIIQSPMNQMTEEEQSLTNQMAEEEQSPMIEMTEEELAMHDEAASAAQKLRENDDSTDFDGTTVSVKETEVIDFSINDEIYNDPFSESYAAIEN
jgi:hypothetical protein